MVKFYNIRAIYIFSILEFEQNNIEIYDNFNYLIKIYNINIEDIIKLINNNGYHKINSKTYNFNIDDFMCIYETKDIDNYFNMATNNFYTDVKVKINGIDYNLHKSILVKESDYFKILFDNNFMKEEHVLNIVDVNENMLDNKYIINALEYIYNGNIKFVRSDNIMEIYYINKILLISKLNKKLIKLITIDLLYRSIDYKLLQKIAKYKNEIVSDTNYICYKYNNIEIDYYYDSDLNKYFKLFNCRHIHIEYSEMIMEIINHFKEMLELLFKYKYFFELNNYDDPICNKDYYINNKLIKLNQIINICILICDSIKKWSNNNLDVNKIKLYDILEDIEDENIKKLIL